MSKKKKIDENEELSEEIQLLKKMLKTKKL